MAAARHYRRLDAQRTEKQCRTCEEVKPIDDFYFQNKETGARQSECKSCMHLRTTAWKNRNADQIRPVQTEAAQKSRRRNPKAAMISAARNRAAIKGQEFDLTDGDVFVPEFCPVLGIRLEWPTDAVGSGNYDLSKKDTRPSIDRIDNSRGYTSDNIVIVSYRANRIKSDATAAELRKIADFYEDLDEHHRRAEKARHQSEQLLSGESLHDMPRVQSQQERIKQEDQVPECQD